MGLTHTQANYAVFRRQHAADSRHVERTAAIRSSSGADQDCHDGDFEAVPALVNGIAIEQSGRPSRAWRTPGTTVPCQHRTTATSIPPTMTTGAPVKTTRRCPRPGYSCGTNGGPGTVTVPAPRQLTVVRVGRNNLAPLDEKRPGRRLSLADKSRRAGSQQRVYADGRPRARARECFILRALRRAALPSSYPARGVKADVSILGNGNVAITLAADIEMSSPLTPVVLMRPEGSGPDRPPHRRLSRSKRCYVTPAHERSSVASTSAT